MIEKSYDEINDKIKKGKAVVMTAEEIIKMVDDEGITETTKKVDVVTTGTFGPMCSSGAFLNFGHSDPPIKMNKVWLNNVLAYSGLAAVDVYIGATEVAEELHHGEMYGGAHIIEELIGGKDIHLKALGTSTDCYPKEELEGYININTINECMLYNPRNAYQNYAAATNSTKKMLYTYMGMLLPNYGNVNYSTSGELSPLLNDPYFKTIGIGTRIFLGGGVGYVSWYGTQHNPTKERNSNGVPVGTAGTISVIGDMKQMNTEFIKAAVYKNYGISLMVGIGVPIPLINEEITKYVSVKNKDIQTGVLDYGVPSRSRPVLKMVNYEELLSGEIELNGNKVRTASMSSMLKARKIANILKEQINEGKFLLTQPVENLPIDNVFKPLNVFNKEDNK